MTQRSTYLTALRFRPIWLLCGLWILSGNAFAQDSLTAKSIALVFQPTTLLEDQLSAFQFSEVAERSPDSSKAMLLVRILEKDGQLVPVQGATVLLSRDVDKMLGRITKADGRCTFSSHPALYTVRVQMTGLASVERTGIPLIAGKVYALEIRMDRQ